jgi:putative tricarboxylic transport membrane protein
MTTGGETARSDLLGGAGWIVFGLAVIAGAWRMDRFESMGATLYTMPGLVPGIFGAVIVLLGGTLALRGARRMARERAPAAPPPFINRRVVAMLALTGVYAVGLVGRAPFWLGTLLFVGGFTLAYGDPARPLSRRVLACVVAAVATTAAVVLVFEQIFLVRLP